MLLSLQAECFLLPVFVCFSICFLLCGILESSQWGTADGGIAKQDSALRINAVKHRPCNLLNGSESLWNCPIPFALSPVWPRIGCLWTRAKRCPLSALHFTRAPLSRFLFPLCVFSRIHHLVWAHDECKSNQRGIWTGSHETSRKVENNLEIAKKKKKNSIRRI